MMEKILVFNSKKGNISMVLNVESFFPMKNNMAILLKQWIDK